MIYVTLRFDDGTESQYSEAFNYMKQFSLPGSVFPIGKNLQKSEEQKQKQKHEYIQIEQLIDMQKHGWEVGYHSYTHSQDWTKDPAKFSSETNVQFLTDQGLLIETFAFPHSVYNHEVINYLQEKFMGLLGIPSKVGNSMQYLPFYNLFRCYTITREQKLDQILEVIHNAIEQDEYLILLFHKIERGPDNFWSFPVRRFRKLIQTLKELEKQGLIQVITFREAIKKIKEIQEKSI